MNPRIEGLQPDKAEGADQGDCGTERGGALPSRSPPRPGFQPPRSLDHLSAKKELGKRHRPDEAEQRDEQRRLEVNRGA